MVFFFMAIKLIIYPASSLPCSLGAILSPFSSLGNMLSPFSSQIYPFSSLSYVPSRGMLYSPLPSARDLFSLPLLRRHFVRGSSRNLPKSASFRRSASWGAAGVQRVKTAERNRGDREAWSRLILL